MKEANLKVCFLFQEDHLHLLSTFITFSLDARESFARWICIHVLSLREIARDSGIVPVSFFVRALLLSRYENEHDFSIGLKNAVLFQRYGWIILTNAVLFRILIEPNKLSYNGMHFTTEWTYAKLKIWQVFSISFFYSLFFNIFFYVLFYI